MSEEIIIEHFEYQEEAEVYIQQLLFMIKINNFQEGGAAKTDKAKTLDSLSKEELIGRCKNLLQLAQKAKNAKDGECPCFVLTP